MVRPPPTFRTAYEIRRTAPPQIPWIAQPFVAEGALTEVDALPKMGKTTWLMELVACVLDGRPFMGAPTRRMPVVYLTEEGDLTLGRVLERSDIDHPDLHLLTWSQTVGMSWPETVDLAFQKCVAVGSRFLVIDTLSQFANMTGDEENVAAAAHRVMVPLQTVAAAGIGCACPRHERKTGGDAGQSARGSNAYAGIFDVIIALQKGKTPEQRVLRIKGRLAEPTEMVVEQTEAGYVVLGDLNAVKLAESRKHALAVLPGRPTYKSRNHWARAIGGRRALALQAIDSLLADQTVQDRGTDVIPRFYPTRKLHNFVDFRAMLPVSPGK